MGCIVRSLPCHRDGDVNDKDARRLFISFPDLQRLSAQHRCISSLAWGGVIMREGDAPGMTLSGTTIPVAAPASCGPVTSLAKPTGKAKGNTT